MSALSKLGEEVSASLEQARAQDQGAARARVRARLVAAKRPSSQSTFKLRTGRVVAILAVAAAVPAFFIARSSLHLTAPQSSQQQALSFTIGKDPGATNTPIAASPVAETPVSFSDGSQVRLAPAARVRVAEVAPNGARVRVEQGTVRVAVVHRDDTKWALEAGPFEVRVTGTKFELGWDPAQSGLVVRLEEGSVVVKGCGNEERRMVTGDVLELSCATKVAAAAAPVPTTREATPEDLPEAPAPTKAVAKPEKPAAAANVLTLAKQGSHKEALLAAEANGFANTCDALSGPELLVLADASRYAGRFDRANEALESTRKRFAGTDAAATAAFELGRIAMDIKHDLGEGGDHFETYLRERPSGSLAREALGRALEARSRTSDARAEALAIRYLAAYPDGPHAKLARKVTEDRP